MPYFIESDKFYYFKYIVVKVHTPPPFSICFKFFPFSFLWREKYKIWLCTQDQFLNFDFTFSFGVYLGKLIAQDHEQLKSLLISTRGPEI
ncbi:hypothetical protein L2E82_07078 [Cichorium intybus]|uniref:Uncharacterized protein n=1 Tax=Cichorium intybus TaxID=13427 RepID=A0ACB9G4T5_CICIN|nr:hypothetical protein L2E82_07078 [Cichorium intybus]